MLTNSAHTQSPRRTLRWFALAVAQLMIFRWLAIAVTAAAQEQEPSPEQLLNLLEQSLKPYRNSEFQFESKTMFYGPSAPGGFLTKHEKARVRCVGETVQSLVETQSWMIGEEGKTTEARYLEDRVVGPGKARVAVINPKSRKAEYIVQPAAEDSESRRVPESLYFSVFFGQFRGCLSESFFDILRQSRLTLKMDEGRPSQVCLVGSGNYGDWEIWLDRSQNYLPVSIELRKHGRHWYKPNKPLKDAPATGKTPMFPGGKVETARRHLHTTTFMKVDGHPLISSFVFTEEMNLAGGETLRFETEARVTGLRFLKSNEPEMIKWDVVIPEGTSVIVQNQSQIEHVFRDGKVVKNINEESLERLRGNRFQRGRWLNRGLLLIVGFSAVILVLAGFAAWRRRRAEE